MKKALYTRLLIIGILSLFIELFATTFAKAQLGGKTWKVWVKTTPCSGRYDWISVAKTNPSGGGNFFYLANSIFPGTACTNEGCTFLEATAIATTLRISSEFSNYCCREYSVWRNDITGKMSVVVGKFGTAGAGWTFVKGDLCCEEAETLAGIPGACSGSIKNTQPKTQNIKCGPGSHAEYNPQTKRAECFCNQGLVWNSTRTACVDPQDLIQTADCSVYPGTYAAINPNTNKVECYCNPGLVWNSTRTACVDPQELAKSSDCSAYPGSRAVWNNKTQRVECQCPTGKKWNATMTACIDVTGNSNKSGKNNGSGGNATWTLVSVTVNPEDPTKVWTTDEMRWTYNAQSPSAVYSSTNGTRVNHSWTPPPQQFTNSGFAVSLNVQATNSNGQSVSGAISVSGGGLNSDVEDKSVQAAGQGSASGSKTINFKPASNYSDIEFKVSIGFGSVTYIYKYKRT